MVFDDDRLVGDARVITPATLAAHLGLRNWLTSMSILVRAWAGECGPKAMTLVHALLAGADSIDDCDVLRAGSIAAVLGHAVAAPCTIGTFLRSSRGVIPVRSTRLPGGYSPGRGRQGRDRVRCL